MFKQFTGLLSKSLEAKVMTGAIAKDLRDYYNITTQNDNLKYSIEHESKDNILKSYMDIEEYYGSTDEEKDSKYDEIVKDYEETIEDNNIKLKKVKDNISKFVPIEDIERFFYDNYDETELRHIKVTNFKTKGDGEISEIILYFNGKQHVFTDKDLSGNSFTLNDVEAVLKKSF